MALRFASFELDEDRYQLRRSGEVQKLEPKTFDVLSYLVRHRERVVSKEELLEQLWPGEFVTESVLPSNVAQLRRALGDERSDPTFIKTIYGRGYQFVAAIEEHAPAGEEVRPFVGREAVFGELAGILDEALAGTGRLVLLVGEPGIGKTRTLDELAALARDRGARVLVGRSHEGEGAPSFWPWVQILRASLRDRSPEMLRAELGPFAAEIAQLVPELRAALPETPGPPVTDAPEEARFRLFDAVTRHLFTASSSDPLVLVLDDLHWADRPSLLLLEFLTRELRDARLLVVGAYRDMEVRRGQPLAQALGELTSQPYCRRVALQGLDAAAVATYVRGATGRDAPEELVGSIHSRTGGNPYFVGEIVRLVDAEGELTRLPEGVRDAIGRRLDALSPECNRVLTAASVLGRDFSVAPLAPLLDLSREALFEILEEAVAARILEEAPRSGGHYAFAHALVRETLYDELSAPRRLRLHREVGEVLERLHERNPGPVLAALAHHFFQAAPGGEAAKAVAWARRAAERAEAQLAYEEAAGHYARALEALELALPAELPAGERTRGELLLALGAAWLGAGERSRSRAAYERAGNVARAAGIPDILAEAALGLGVPWEFGWGPDETLRRMLEDARDALGEADSGLRARVLARLSGTHPYLNASETRQALTREALAIARRVGGRYALLESLDAMGFDMNLGPPAPDWFEQRKARADEYFEIARMTDDAPTTSAYDPVWKAHDTLLHTYLHSGDIVRAERELEACAEIAARQRLLYQQFDMSSARFGLEYARGHFEDARRLMREGRALAQRMNPSARSFWITQAFTLARDLGIEEAGDTLRDPRVLERILANIEQDWPWLHLSARSMTIHASVQLGRLDAARRDFEEVAAQDFATTGLDMGWLFALALQAEVAVALEHEPGMQRLHELLSPFDLNVVGVGGLHHFGWISHFVGILDAGLGRLEDAERALRHALAKNEAMGSPVHATRTRVELGRVLRESEPDEAFALLRQARAEIEARGLAGIAPRVP